MGSPFVTACGGWAATARSRLVIAIAIFRLSSHPLSSAGGWVRLTFLFINCIFQNTRRAMSAQQGDRRPGFTFG